MKRASEATTAQLEALRGRVAHWRAHRDGGRSMVPEDLWNAAVEVARVAGVHATSKALRFNYYSLKDRLVRADSAALTRRKPDRNATFVEVQMPSLPSLAPRQEAVNDKTVVELVGTGGARMRIDVTGASRVDVVGLAQAFWSVGARSRRASPRNPRAGGGVLSPAALRYGPWTRCSPSADARSAPTISTSSAS